MVEAKDSYGNGLGEERTLLITPVVAFREYAETLEAGGQPPASKVYQRSDGRHVVQVVPQGCVAGYHVEQWSFGAFQGTNIPLS